MDLLNVGDGARILGTFATVQAFDDEALKDIENWQLYRVSNKAEGINSRNSILIYGLLLSLRNQGMLDPVGNGCIVWYLSGTRRTETNANSSFMTPKPGKVYFIPFLRSI